MPTMNLAHIPRSIFLSLCLLFIYLCLPHLLFAQTTLRIGFSDNKPHVFTDKDGKPTGFYVDILEYVAAKENWQLIYIKSMWDENLNKLVNEKIDIILDIGFSAERSGKMNFSKVTLIEDSARLYVGADSAINSWIDIDNKRIGMVRDDIHTASFSKLIQFVGIDPVIVLSDSYIECEDLLKKGNVHGVILPNLHSKRITEQTNFIKSDILFNPIELRFAAPKDKHDDILARIDHHVAILQKNPSSFYYQSLTKWTEGVQRVVLPGWVNPGWLVSGVVCLILLILIFNLLLRYQVKVRTKALQASIAIQQKQESELLVAKEIQLGLLPEPFYEVGDFSFQAFIEPAKMVGGDFFDFFRLSGDDNRLCFLIADVADKGIPAALFMASAKTYISVMARELPSLEKLIEGVNKEVSKNNPRCMFVTMFCGFLDLDSGDLRYTLAGHEPPVLIRKNNEIIALNQAHCMALGLDEDAEYEQAKITMSPGDMIFMYTDGVSEALNSKGLQFGEDALKSILLDKHNKSSKDIVVSVQKAVQAFVGNTTPHDDITMVCLKRND